MVILIGSYPFLSLRFFFYSPWQSSPAAGSVAAAQAWAEPGGRPVRRARRCPAARVLRCHCCPAALESHRSQLSPVCPLPNSLILLLFYSPGVPQSRLTIKVVEGKRHSPDCWMLERYWYGPGRGHTGVRWRRWTFPCWKAVSKNI